MGLATSIQWVYDMQKYLIFTSFGWLTLIGAGHFCVDVVLQYLRGQRMPGSETTLYYGLNSAFALGQVAVGILGLFLAWRALSLASSLPVLGIAALAGIAWLSMTFMFMEYTEPRYATGIYCFLIFLALISAAVK